MSTFYLAKWLVAQNRVMTDMALEVRDGKVVGYTPKDQVSAQVVDLGDVALVPGLVNAHSHAFQRSFRGKTEYLSVDQDADDFWSWRTRMYDAALSLNPQSMYDVALSVYQEMIATGITSVGEFHYVHHQPNGQPYDDANEMANVVIEAARAAGLRIVLLRVFYHRAGFDQPANPRQRRFIEPSVDVALKRVDDLRSRWAGDDAVQIGLAPHSIRAVDRSWFGPISAYQQQHQMPLHIHACEQRAEIAQSIQEYGGTPIELLRDVGLLNPSTTLVHATHLSARDLDLLGEHRPFVCACPSTERNLGDGFLPALGLMRQRVPICLGSDSHANIDLWDEMRLVEYHERLRYERRNVLAQAYGVWFDGDHQQANCADLLWPMGTQWGAESLKLNTGSLDVGQWADMLTVDPEHWSLRGTQTSSLLSDLVFSIKPGAVTARWVAGQLL